MTRFNDVDASLGSRRERVKSRGPIEADATERQKFEKWVRSCYTGTKRFSSMYIDYEGLVHVCNEMFTYYFVKSKGK